MRRHVAPLALVALVLLSGCAGVFGGGSVPDRELNAEPAGGEGYAWNASADAHIELTTNARFRAVYRINRSARDEIELYRRDGFGGRNPIPVSAVRYRYPNGTVLTGTELAARGGGVSRSRDVVTVRFPNESASTATNGTAKLAFSSGSTPKRFSLPTFVKGSYEVVLPADRRVEVPVFGSARPRDYATERVDGRTHIRWADVQSDTVVVRYYLQRDLYIFGGVAAGLLVVGVVGTLYYRRQIRKLREQREELGLDVDTGDDFGDDGPPPGMR
ncbi:MAG: DUF5803 family protein [Haloferacaceae archaeon]